MTAAVSGASAAIAWIAKAGGARIDPPTVLPARLVTELSGEAVRARLCAFTDESGADWCLRPDMTTPIADLVARGTVAPGRHHYSGPVYRLPVAGRGDAIEFQQAGFEWFGGGGPQEDAEATALTLEAVARGGCSDADVRFGDVGLFLALLEVLPVSVRWRERLARAFRRRNGIEALLRGEGVKDRRGGEGLAAGLAMLPDDVAAQVIRDVFSIAGVRPVGGRSPEEIVARLREQQEDGPPDPAIAEAVLAFQDLTAPVADALAAVHRLFKSGGVKPDAASLDRFEARLSALAALDPPKWAAAHYHASAGRRFDYYDGFVFEVARPGAQDLPVAAGGRYDGLIGRLSADRTRLTAIGASVRLDRLSAGTEGS